MSESELNSALIKVPASLGDRYTRYLPPAKYATIVQVPFLKPQSFSTLLDYDQYSVLVSCVCVGAGCIPRIIWRAPALIYFPQTIQKYVPSLPTVNLYQKRHPKSSSTVKV